MAKFQSIQSVEPPLNRRGAIISAVALLGSWNSRASANGILSYPEQPIKIIVPFQAGGPTDKVARLLAAKFQGLWKTPAIVDNKPGAGSALGAAYIAKSKADGYNLLFTTGGLLSAPEIFKEVGYDPINDFVPIANTSSVPALLLANNSIPYQNLRQLIVAAKKEPATITYATPGVGTPLHLAAESFQKAAGIRLIHIPYKGSAGALTDLIGGQVDLMFDSPLTSLPLVRGGKIKALAISSERRSDVAPDIPTFMEEGVAAYSFSLWYALFAPAKTPADIIAKLSEATGLAISDPEIKEKIIDLGAVPSFQASEPFKRQVAKDFQAAVTLVRELNITGTQK